MHFDAKWVGGKLNHNGTVFLRNYVHILPACFLLQPIIVLPCIIFLNMKVSAKLGFIYAYCHLYYTESYISWRRRVHVWRQKYPQHSAVHSWVMWAVDHTRRLFYRQHLTSLLKYAHPLGTHLFPASLRRFLRAPTSEKSITYTNKQKEIRYGYHGNAQFARYSNTLWIPSFIRAKLHSKISFIKWKKRWITLYSHCLKIFIKYNVSGLKKVSLLVD